MQVLQEQIPAMLATVVETNTKFMSRTRHFSTNYRNLSSASKFNINLWDSSALKTSCKIFRNTSLIESRRLGWTDSPCIKIENLMECCKVIAFYFLII